MTKEKGRKYDGRSRPTNAVYAKNWNDIFNKPKNKKLKNVITEEQWVKQMIKNR